MNHRPPRPVEAYPVAELPPVPPAPTAGTEATDPAPAPARPPAEVAILRFLGPQSATVALEQPFEWEGVEVHTITARRLTVAEVGAVMIGYGDDDPIEIWDFVAAMTGLPAAVLRGLAGDDGAEVLATARPLLPRFARSLLPLAAEVGTGSETTSSDTGDGQRSPPAV